MLDLRELAMAVSRRRHAERGGKPVSCRWGRQEEERSRSPNGLGYSVELGSRGLRASTVDLFYASTVELGAIRQDSVGHANVVQRPVQDSGVDRGQLCHVHKIDDPAGSRDGTGRLSQHGFVRLQHGVAGRLGSSQTINHQQESVTDWTSVPVSNWCSIRCRYVPSRRERPQLPHGPRRIPRPTTRPHPHLLGVSHRGSQQGTATGGTGGELGPCAAADCRWRVLVSARERGHPPPPPRSCGLAFDHGLRAVRRTLVPAVAPYEKGRVDPGLRGGRCYLEIGSCQRDQCGRRYSVRPAVQRWSSCCFLVWQGSTTSRITRLGGTVMVTVVTATVAPALLRAFDAWELAVASISHHQPQYRPGLSKGAAPTTPLDS